MLVKHYQGTYKPRNILPIIMGDFNCIINACDTTENYVQKQCIPLKDLVNLFKYKDSFNHVNPGIQEYTYHRRGVAPSRLDRAYIPEHLVGELEEAYHQATLSDHRAIVVKLKRIYSPPIQRKESPYWKLNVSILNHRDFIPGFVNVWGKLLTQEISFPSTDIWWETLVKPELKRFLIQFSSMRSKERRSQKSFLFAGLDKELASGNFNEVNNIRVKLKSMISEDAIGYIVRSRYQRQAEEERSTLYHINQEVKHGKSNNLSKMMVNGMETEDRGIVEGEVLGFFNSLYQGQHRSVPGQLAPVDTGQKFEGNMDLMPEFLENVQGIPAEEARNIENKITLEETITVIENSKPGKSPGLDGIPYEFYKVTKNIIGYKLVEIFQSQLDKGEVVKSGRKGHQTSPKGRGDTQSRPSETSNTTLL